MLEILLVDRAEDPPAFGFEKLEDTTFGPPARQTRAISESRQVSETFSQAERRPDDLKRVVGEGRCCVSASRKARPGAAP